MIKQEIREIISSILGDNLPKYSLEEPPKGIPGDIGTNLLLVLSPQDKERQKKLYNTLRDKIHSQEIIDKIDFVEPGFINFWLSHSRLVRELKTVLVQRDSYPIVDMGKGEKVLIEFVSANPTGPLHIGHGRGAIIGDVLSRIFIHLGYSCEREYYVNDRGTQVEILAKSVMLHCPDEYLTDEERCLRISTDNLYKGDYIKQIAENIMIRYPDTSKRPTGEVFFRQEAVKLLLEHIKSSMESININFDKWFYESELYNNGEVEKTIQLLQKHNCTYEKGDALWLNTMKYGDDKDRVIVRRNKQTTYFAADIAYHRNKFNRGYSRLINIWGADHHGYVARIKAAMQLLGFDTNKLIVVLYQLVSLLRAGKSVSMSTREGEFISLDEVTNEIGKDALRYFLSTRSPEAHLEFDLMTAKKQSAENPVYHIQYAHARICSILREAKDQVGFYLDKIDLDDINWQCLSESMERTLMAKIVFYPEVLVACIETLTTHYLPEYLLELAGLFHKYYEQYRVISADKQLSLARLCFVSVIKFVLKNGLTMLGITAPESM